MSKILLYGWFPAAMFLVVMRITDFEAYVSDKNSRNLSNSIKLINGHFMSSVLHLRWSRVMKSNKRKRRWVCITASFLLAHPLIHRMNFLLNAIVGRGIRYHAFFPLQWLPKRRAPGIRVIQKWMLTISYLVLSHFLKVICTTIALIVAYCLSHLSQSMLQVTLVDYLPNCLLRNHYNIKYRCNRNLTSCGDPR